MKWILDGKSVDRASTDSGRVPRDGAMERIGGSRNGRWGKRLVGMKSKDTSSIIGFEIQP